MDLRWTGRFVACLQQQQFNGHEERQHGAAYGRLRRRALLWVAASNTRMPDGASRGDIDSVEIG
jgi:hypothetical protein